MKGGRSSEEVGGLRPGSPELRAEFPLLAREAAGRPVAYLDSAATSQKPRAVLEAMDGYLRRSNGNAHRGSHRLAEESSVALEEARAAAARFCGVSAPGEIVFTSSATAALNLVAQGWALPRLRPGDEILVTELEHHANLLPWQRVAQRTGAVLRAIPVDGEGRLALDQGLRLVGPRTRVLAAAWVSNLLGTVQPLPALIEAARAVGAAVVVDACQAAPHLPLEVASLGADFLAFAGHKVLGPTGLGVLWARPERLEETEPLLLGGGIVAEVFVDRATLRPPPQRFEAGTPPVAEAVGLRAALDFLDGVGRPALADHGRALCRALRAGLAGLPGVRVFGPPEADHLSAVSFALDGLHAHDVAAALDERGICVRSGHHCAQPLVRKLGVAGTVRASFGPYSTEGEVAALVDALGEVRALLGAGPP